MTDKITDDDVKRLTDFVNGLDIDTNVRPEAFGYDSAVLVCLDAVLSINRQYKRFVVPRLHSFRQEYPRVRTLDALASMMTELGEEGFGAAWRYRHASRIATLRALVAKYTQLRDELHESEDLRAMQTWAHATRTGDWKAFGVRGIGFATFQYLRMMLGVSTVKPDVHIKRVTSQVLGRAVNDTEAIALVERVAAGLRLPATTVDHAIWKYSSNRLGS